MRLEAENLLCRRGGRSVFRAVSFALAPGQALIVRGPNGAGKTSLLRLIAGLLRPQAGRIVFRTKTAARLHYVAHAGPPPFARPAARLRLLEAFAFQARLLTRAAPPEENLRAALACFGLAPCADLPLRALSAGQGQRLALSRLLLDPRPLWLLDEPFTALDRAAQDQLTGLLRDHLAAGGLIVMAAHGPAALPGAQEMFLSSPEPEVFP